MNKPTTNEELRKLLNQRLTELDSERDRTVRMLNLLNVTDLLAQDAKVRAKAKEAKPSPKKKRKTLPWRPSSNASPYTQVVYDALENGENLTSLQIQTRVVNAGFPAVTLPAVTNVLSWMKSSGRLTYNKGHWRRKFARYASKNEPITSDKITGKNAHKVMGRLDARVERGEYTKSVDGNGRVTWTPTAPSSGTDQ